MLDYHTTPFTNAEEAWFWFIQATKARADGARISANQGAVIRPCDPDDIMKILERLHRHRRLDMNHFRVMNHYGKRMIAPDPYHARESYSALIWKDAMAILSEILIAKNIVLPSLSAEIIDFQTKREAVPSW